MSVADRLAEVRGRIASAARSAGRDPAGVRLIAVSKTFPLQLIREAAAAGQRDFGENRVQEGLQKISASTDLEIRWHLLGHLQTNKARKAGLAFAAIHGVDSVELLQKLDAAALEAGRSPELLIQVDLAGEATKHGVPPDEVPRLLEAAAASRAARVVGLMTLPPLPETPEGSRAYFRQLRELRDEWLTSGVPAPMLRELSMGMSGDFEVAVQEGATMVRVVLQFSGADMLKLDDHANLIAPQGPAPLAPPNPDARRLPAPERHVSVTPIDMRQARFGSAMRGFDRTEVTAFLAEAASGYEHTLRENDRLRQQIAALEASLSQYRELEGGLKSTLVSAQKVADDIRQNAHHEAARLVSEAQGRVELMTQKAQARVEDAGREIDTLKLKRREVQTNIEACVSSLQSTLDFVREQDQRERDQRVVPHRAPIDIAKPA